MLLQKIFLSKALRIILSSYSIILCMAFLYHAWPLRVMVYLIPLVFYSVPLIVNRSKELTMRGLYSLRFNLRDTGVGIIASIFVLLPTAAVLYLLGRGFHIPDSAWFLIYQFFGSALPEEVYFRGFVQATMGNNIKSLFLTSILFSVMHLPKLIFYGEILSPLTFFPSLIMGFLYYKTGNVLTSTIFHFLANMFYYGFN